MATATAGGHPQLRSVFTSFSPVPGCKYESLLSNASGSSQQGKNRFFFPGELEEELNGDFIRVCPVLA